jgi:hypothetical protein
MSEPQTPGAEAPKLTSTRFEGVTPIFRKTKEPGNQKRVA